MRETRSWAETTPEAADGGLRAERMSFASVADDGDVVPAAGTVAPRT
jgi:hypothetical protein